MDHLRRTAQHATKLAKHHNAIAAAVTKCFGKTKKAAAMADLSPEALNELLESFEENHSAIGDELMSYAEDCAQCADEAAEKAAQDRLRKRTGDGATVPTGVRIATPPGLVLIPRNQNSLPAAANVAPEFQKLIAIEDEETTLQK